MIDPKQQLRIIEGALFASDKPLTVNELAQLFTEEERPSNPEIKALLTEIIAFYADRGLQLHHLASGYCFRVSADLAPWVSRLWEVRPPRYSRALMETLAVIAYRQPVTRGDIEQVRGVNVSPGTIKTLLDREWIQIVGHRDVPGRPELMATTAQFLDYFGLRSIEELPTLMAIKEIDTTADEAEKVLQFEHAMTELPPEEEQRTFLEIKTAEATTLMLSAPFEHSEAQ